MNDRIRFTIILSAPDFPYQAVVKSLGERFSQCFAGACFQPIDGFWSKGGESVSDKYEAGSQESGAKIILSVMPDKGEVALTEIKQALQALKRELDLPIRWVHIEAERVRAHHLELT
jgi:hypothetical protein